MEKEIEKYKKDLSGIKDPLYKFSGNWDEPFSEEELNNYLKKGAWKEPKLR